MKLISTKTHGLLDYLTAGMLVALPRALGWSWQATNLMTLAGVGTVVYSALTDYELGLVRTLPFKTHLALDSMSGALFCAAPLLLRDEASNVRTILVGIGLFEVTASLLTETEPRWELEEVPSRPKLDPSLA